MSLSIILLSISVLGLILYNVFVYRSINNKDSTASIFLSFNILFILLIYKYMFKSFIPTTYDFYTHLVLVLTLGIICRIIHISLNFTFSEHINFGRYFFKESLNSLIIYFILIFIICIFYTKEIGKDTIMELFYICLSSSILISVGEYAGFNVSDILSKKNSEDIGVNSGTGNSSNDRGGSSSGSRGGSRGGSSSGRGDLTGDRSRRVSSGRISKDSSHIGSSSGSRGGSSGGTRHRAVLSRDSIRTRDIHLTSPTLNELSREYTMQSETNPEVYNTYPTQSTIYPQVAVNPQVAINPQVVINPQVGITTPIDPIQSNINPQMPITSFVGTSTNSQNFYFLQDNVNPQVPIASYPIQSGVYTQMPSTVNPIEGGIYNPSYVHSGVYPHNLYSQSGIYPHNPYSLQSDIYSQVGSYPNQSGLYSQVISHPSQSSLYSQVPVSYPVQSDMYPQVPMSYPVQSDMYPQVPLSHPVQSAASFVPHIQTGINPFGFNSPGLQPEINPPLVDSTETVFTPVVEPAVVRPVVIPSGLEEASQPLPGMEIWEDISTPPSYSYDPRLHDMWVEKFISAKEDILAKRPGTKEISLKRQARAAALEYVREIVLAEDNALYRYRQSLSPKTTPPRVPVAQRLWTPLSDFREIPRDFSHTYPTSVSFTLHQREFIINYSIDSKGYITHPRSFREIQSYNAGQVYYNFWRTNPRTL